jgi:hypothetical protein
MMQRFAALTLLIALATTTNAFTVVNPRSASASSRTAPLGMAGFGTAPKKKGGKKKDVKQLKPKQQWDRYTGDLKSCDSIRVAVRIVESSSPVAETIVDLNEWYEVGAVKSKDNAYTEAAVIRHRVLMAEHARRIFPTTILANDKLEWGYTTATATATADTTTDTTTTTVDWTVVGKVDMPEGIEKLIGFQGNADPTGFYARKAQVMSDNSSSGFQNMKNKGIVGHVAMEVHD